MFMGVTDQKLIYFYSVCDTTILSDVDGWLTILQTTYWLKKLNANKF